MPPDRCGCYRFSVPVAVECAELFPLPEEAERGEKARYKSGDVNYNTGHLLYNIGHLLYNIGHMFYNIGHMFYKTAHPRYKSSDMCYKIGDMFYKSVDMPRIPLIIAPVCNDNRSPCEITPNRREAHREPRRSSQSQGRHQGFALVEQAIPKAAGVLAACPAGLSRACRVYFKRTETPRNAFRFLGVKLPYPHHRTPHSARLPPQRGYIRLRFFKVKLFKFNNEMLSCPFCSQLHKMHRLHKVHRLQGSSKMRRPFLAAHRKTAQNERE